MLFNSYTSTSLVAQPLLEGLEKQVIFLYVQRLGQGLSSTAATVLHIVNIKYQIEVYLKVGLL